MWYNEFGTAGDVVLSSRVRLARNIKDIPFGEQMTKEHCEKVIDQCKGALTDMAYIDFEKMPSWEKLALAECHIVSPDMANNNKKCGILTNADCTISVMLNEEDHIRIQAMAAGFNLDECLSKANAVDDELEKIVDYGFDERFGYLTYCPTNLGTGMRASVMLHLPALTKSGKIDSIICSLSKIGLIARGIYGEGSQAIGNIYQISNQVTLGVSEQEIIEKLKQVTDEIVEKEREMGRTLYSENKFSFEDKIMRAYGTLTNAVLLSSNEAMSLISDVRWGVNLGIIKDITLPDLSKLVYETLPGGLMKKYNLTTSLERDLKRAEVLKENLKDKEK